MGVKKSGKKATKSKGAKAIAGKAGKVASAIGAKLMGGGSKKAGGGYRRHSRLTPEKLAKQILILKLKKRLYRLKYGGR